MRSKTGWTKGNAKSLVTAFIRSLRLAIDQFQPTKLILPIDDYVGNSFRRKIFPEYKAPRAIRNNKDPLQIEFKKQKGLVLEVIEKFLPVHSFKYKGYEADDIIAIISRIVSDDVQVVIWSNDQDLVQLQQHFPNVHMYNPQYKDFMPHLEYDIVAYKALVGDKSDNIPGVRGIGRKTALRLLNSKAEFIKSIASDTKKYIEFRKNKRVIDLIDNDLAIPENLVYILNNKVKFDYKGFEKFAHEHKLVGIINDLSNLNTIFCNLQLKNNNAKRQWFFNAKEHNDGEE